MVILIVDDQPVHLKLLRAQLESAGHSVLGANHGAEALEVLAREHADAVISDILMPTMDGFRLCQEIRGTETFSALPFIFYTSTYDSAVDRALAENIGADVYLLKPAPLANVLSALAEAERKSKHRSPPPVAALTETQVLKHYSESLVQKLEARNEQLQQALTQIRAAHEQILELNRSLESRVKQRTAELNFANTELEAFSYSVSHDLRSPLRHIRGFAQLLAESAGSRLDTEGQGYLQRIAEGARRMDQLIHDLLEFSRTSRAPMQRMDIDLSALVASVISDLQPDLQNREIEWIVQPLPHASGDASLLRQVLVNLISNAVKYTRPRTLARIEIHSQSSDRELTLCVRDNGVGFDMQFAGKLFGVFQRMHTDEQFEGTGIGLANAQRVVARHGGRMWAEAEVDHGAAFYVSLPRASADHAREQGPS